MAIKVKEEIAPVLLNLGCGFRKVYGYINIDNRKECNPDVVSDALEALQTYGDSTVDEVRAYDFMEHIPSALVPFYMREIHRVLKPEGVFSFFIPSTDGRGAFMDPTHVSFWNINSWLYYCDVDWNALYSYLPLFKIIELQDVMPSEKMRIIYTVGKVCPVK